MELDVPQFISKGPCVIQFVSIPEEIHLKILFMLDPLDILALGRTCRLFAKFASNEHLW